MKKKEIEQMLDGIDDSFIQAASENHVRKGGKSVFRKVAAAMVAFVLVAGTSISILAATNAEFRGWLHSFDIKETEYGGSKGVEIQKNETNHTETSKKNETQYLELSYIPKGFACEKNDTSLYRKKESDTKFFTVAYFALKAQFTNVLPQSGEMKSLKTKSGTAYIASNHYENRIWILFNDGDYMVEIRDVNRSLSNDEIQKMVDGASISSKEGSTKYETLEWTRKLQDSYMKWLAKYTG